MDAPAMTAGDSRAATPRQSAAWTLAVMVITAVVIVAVAFVVNQP